MQEVRKVLAQRQQSLCLHRAVVCVTAARALRVDQHHQRIICEKKTLRRSIADWQMQAVFLIAASQSSKLRYGT